MKKVLIVAYYWPPSGGSGVQRWVKFVKYLQAEGWTPIVYTPENPEYTAVDKTLAAEVPADVEVIRRPILEPYNLYRRMMGKDAGTDIKQLTADSAGAQPKAGNNSTQPVAGAAGGAVTEISGGHKTWKQKLSLWIRANLFVPDPRVGWVRPSVRFLKQYLKEHPVDALVTTGPPQSMHLIGLKLHQALGIPWVPDFRDPWTKMYYLRYLPLSARTWRKLRRMEQEVLDGCSTVLSVTPLVQEDFLSRTKTPVAMIPNGYDADDFEGPAPAQDGFFNLTHTGLLASDGNPFSLWEVLGRMAAQDPDFKARLRLRLAGKVDRDVLQAIQDAGLAQNVIDLGYCDHAAAVREQCAATVLLLPLRNDPEYRMILPGKLFEYLAARRPVLGIGQTDGAMARVLQQTEAGVTANWDEPAVMQAFLEKAWEQHKAGGVPPTEGAIGRYERRALTHELAILLNQII